MVSFPSWKCGMCHVQHLYSDTDAPSIFELEASDVRENSSLREYTLLLSAPQHKRKEAWIGYLLSRLVVDYVVVFMHKAFNKTSSMLRTFRAVRPNKLTERGGTARKGEKNCCCVCTSAGRKCWQCSGVRVGLRLSSSRGSSRHNIAAYLASHAQTIPQS